MKFFGSLRFLINDFGDGDYGSGYGYDYGEGEYGYGFGYGFGYGDWKDAGAELIE